MKVCTIKYLRKYDETVIVFKKSFNESDRLLKLDLLKDAIQILEQQYDTILLKTRSKNAK
jgi:activator of HSP90 ATPase